MKTPIPHSSPWLRAHDRAAISRVLDTGMLAKGAEVAAFEMDASRYLHGSTCLAQPNGTTALLLALCALDVGKGDEVILPTYVCRSVLDAVVALDAAPVLVDVDAFGVLSPLQVEPHMTRNTKAIVAVHLFGHRCDLHALSTLGVPVIEDACQAFGLRTETGIAGTLGAIGILSFHATKCLTTGEGGMAVTSDAHLTQSMRSMIASPSSPTAFRFSSMTDIQAALGRSQLGHYADHLTRRTLIHNAYGEAVRRLGLTPGFPDGASFLFRFTLRTPVPFDEVQARALACGFHVRRGVDQLLHRLCGKSDAAFPSAVRCFEETVSIPFYPSLRDAEVSLICDNLAKVFR